MKPSTEAQLRDRIAEVCGREINGHLEIHEDTASYMAISAGSVLRLDAGDYLIR